MEEPSHPVAAEPLDAALGGVPEDIDIPEADASCREAEAEPGEQPDAYEWDPDLAYDQWMERRARELELEEIAKLLASGEITAAEAELIAHPEMDPEAEP
jgi:hypothetical protein